MVLPGRLIPLMARSCFPMPDLSLSQYKHYAVAYAQLAHKGDIHAVAGIWPAHPLANCLDHG